MCSRDSLKGAKGIKRQSQLTNMNHDCRGNVSDPIHNTIIEFSILYFTTDAYIFMFCMFFFKSCYHKLKKPIALKK